MEVWLVLAYDWDGVRRVWGFTKEADAWTFAKAQEALELTLSYSVEPLRLDSQEYI